MRGESRRSWLAHYAVSWDIFPFLARNVRPTLSENGQTLQM
jgi:hypothetical protein